MQHKFWQSSAPGEILQLVNNLHGFCAFALRGIDHSGIFKVKIESFSLSRFAFSNSVSLRRIIGFEYTLQFTTVVLKGGPIPRSSPGCHPSNSLAAHP
jgi:hypothetical protein